MTKGSRKQPLGGICQLITTYSSKGSGKSRKGSEMIDPERLVDVCLFTPHGLKFCLMKWGKIQKIAEACEGVEKERRIPVSVSGTLFMSDDLAFTYEPIDPCLN